MSYCHKGSLCQPLGNPIAAGSTTGYFNADTVLHDKLFIRDMMDVANR